MKAEEIALIQSKHNAAIIAPAGHGKTEMIAQLVDRLPGKKLVITHTNAGVSALSKRFDKYDVDKKKYTLSTIAAFCMRWCEAYPKTAEIDTGIGVTDEGFYPGQHNGARRIFTHRWAQSVLQSSYSYVIVDEYQDCVLEQHGIFLAINVSVPVYVLGDPLQSIFGWAGKPVSWNKLGFEVLKEEIETYPWRWDNGNRELGQYLTEIRDTFLPALDKQEVLISTVPVGNYIRRVSPINATRTQFLKEISEYDSVLYLTKWPKDQCSFSQRSGGVFQNDEAQNLKDLYLFAQFLDDDDGYKRANTIFDFIAECATQVTTELKSYGKHIRDGSFSFNRITSYPEFGIRMSQLYQEHGYNEMIRVLEWIRNNGKFRLYRRELYTELIRSIRHARDNETTILEAAKQIRMIPNNQSRYSNFKRLSSRTVLSKGLEFDCVVIDLSKAHLPRNKFTATEMYVAMTRAMQVIYFISDSDNVTLEVPQGL